MPGVSALILLYITVVVVLDIFINADRRIKGVQTGDWETKQINFADNITNFLKRYYLPYQNASDFYKKLLAQR